MAAITPIRELIMEAVKARLEAIATSSDYHHTVAKVIRTRDALPDYPTTPVIYVYEGEEEKDDGDATGRLLCTLPIAVVFINEDYTDKTTAGNLMLSDVSKAMGVNIDVTTASGKTVAVMLAEATAVVEASDSGDSMVFATQIFEAKYYHAISNQGEQN